MEERSKKRIVLRDTVVLGSLREVSIECGDRWKRHNRRNSGNTASEASTGLERHVGFGRIYLSLLPSGSNVYFYGAHDLQSDEAF